MLLFFLLPLNIQRHRIGKERIKYKTTANEPDQDKIRAVCRAIERESGSLGVRFVVRQNGTTEFTVRGSEDQKELALRLIHMRLKGVPMPEPPAVVFPLSAENVERHNEHLSDRREFACRPCAYVWWRKVFEYKPVSRCPRCHVRYDPIPKEREFGWGRCPNCRNVFTGRAQVGVPVHCFKCNRMVFPDKIGPKPARGRHACEACNNGHIRPCTSYPHIPYTSVPHESTGSTVSTFLTQVSEIEHDFD
ncbi:shiftless antiviral inhibitor of ribosomal frameshifting protein homolog [Diadema antillarum]|uniref:shiftless antiviral inhibitor of ribosomal frameshifting protein homolog n=1 Tax=Diadema antillarum TaxID=105358 RepID=UPI003A8A1178